MGRGGGGRIRGKGRIEQVRGQRGKGREAEERKHDRWPMLRGRWVPALVF